MHFALGWRFRRFAVHPAVTLLAGMMSAGALAVFLTFDVSRGATIPIEVRRAECYRMTYGDPISGATADYFPARIILLPGTDSGSVRLEGSGTSGLWWL